MYSTTIHTAFDGERRGAILTHDTYMSKMWVTVGVRGRMP